MCTRFRNHAQGKAGVAALTARLAAVAQAHADSQPAGHWLRRVQSMHGLVAAALDAFIYADAYAAVVRFLSNAKVGTALALCSWQVSSCGWGHGFFLWGFVADRGA